MRNQELLARLRERSVPVVADPNTPPRIGGVPPAPLDPQQELLEAGAELLREFLALSSSWEHPAAERYRAARAAVEDFGEGE